ncbi:SdrD B-like domain-containing protein [Dyadobacter sp. 676]|uniref:SdrD B-like domain-containing protein n=1 Tax=Dyadobacter sp. 676 TaxID=3088362 RepID=A0AAU8FH14_9BACT
MKYLSLSFLFICNSLSFSAAAEGGSAITGTVWTDKKPYNGLFDAGEQVVPGILVKLLNASNGQVVSTALSQSDGGFSLPTKTDGNFIIEYVFPSEGFSVALKRQGNDNSINSAANTSGYSDLITISAGAPADRYGLGLVAKENTITYCTMKTPTVTTWKEDLLLPKSSVAAVPVGVKIFAAESVWHPSIGIENLGTQDAYDISVQGIMSMELPRGAFLKINSDVPRSGILPAYDGVQDYAGTSGRTWLDEFSYASSRYEYPPFLIDNTFYGEGNLAIPTEAKSGVTIVGSGNQQTVVQTHVSAGACVVYTYEEGALPVKLVSFSARREQGQVQLDWQTAEETNSSHFIIERSSNGKDFSPIGRVKAAGESSVRNMYSYSDLSATAGSNFYRLKMVDLDETYAYSRIVVVKLDSRAASLYPNPAIDEVSVADAGDSSVTKVQFFNPGSQLVLESSQNQNINVSGIPAGTYLVRTVRSDGTVNVNRLVIAR